MANINPSPKQKFLSNAENLKAHHQLLDSDAFEVGVNIALLEYQGRLTQGTPTANDAAMNHFKITGALEFLAVFRNLAETTPIPTRKDVGNLTHQ